MKFVGLLSEMSNEMSKLFELTIFKHVTVFVNAITFQPDYSGY